MLAMISAPAVGPVTPSPVRVTNTCPASMLAHSRTESEMGRKKLDTSSISPRIPRSSPGSPSPTSKWPKKKPDRPKQHNNTHPNTKQRHIDRSNPRNTTNKSRSPKIPSVACTKTVVPQDSSG